MLRRPPRSKRTDTLFPYTTLCRSHLAGRRINTSPPRRRGPLEVYAATKGRADHGRVQRHVTLKCPSRGRRFSASVLPQSRNPAALAHRDERLADLRSEEHTSELQSLMRISYAVFCLKKKKPKTILS